MKRHDAPSSKRALWTVAEAAACLRLSQKGIYSLVELRRIPFISVSNRLRFDPEDVVAWLKQRRVVPLEMK